MTSRVAYDAARSTQKSPRPAAQSSKLLDDVAAASLNALGDRLVAGIEALKQAIEIINVASYADPRWNDRALARRLFGQVLTDVAQVNVELSRPLPVFRAGAGTCRPTVRPRFRDPEIEDVQTASLPATMEVAL